MAVLSLAFAPFSRPSHAVNRKIEANTETVAIVDRSIVGTPRRGEL